MTPAKDGPEEIVKVQLPVATNAPGGVEGLRGEGLIYGRARTHIRQQQLPDHVRAQLNGDIKGYFKAVWTGSLGRWVIGVRTEEQPW